MYVCFGLAIDAGPWKWVASKAMVDSTVSISKRLKFASTIYQVWRYAPSISGAPVHRSLFPHQSSQWVASYIVPPYFLSRQSTPERLAVGIIMHQLMQVIALLFIVTVHRWPCAVAATAPAAAPYKYLHTSHPQCWDNPLQFPPIVFKDCIEVINKEIIRGHDDPTIPLKFSKDLNLHPDIRLPKYWTRNGRKCGVGVDLAPRMQGYDRTTLDDIQRAARAVAVECIIKEPHLGGYMQLGWHHRLGILITGRKIRPIGSNETVEES